MNRGWKIGVPGVDDHPMAGIGVAAVIPATPHITAVAQAGRGEEAVQLFEGRNVQLPHQGKDWKPLRMQRAGNGFAGGAVSESRK